MKVQRWLGDREVIDVVGVYHQIGEDCEKLIEILHSGWTFAGDSKYTPEEGNDADIYTIDSTGLLVPEPDNPTDNEAVAVYLKFVLKKDSKIKVSLHTPSEFMIRIGYLPKDSKLKKRIKYPVQVNIKCRTISAGKNYFQARIMGVPSFYSYKAAKNSTFDINIKDEKE